MDQERSLEAILKDLRRGERFNQHRRQFLDGLRDAGWVASSKLPDTPKTVVALLRNGWIERRDIGAGAEYRITPIGLAELCRPR